MSLLKLFKLNQQALKDEQDQAIHDQELILNKLSSYNKFVAEHLDPLYYNLKDKLKMTYPEDFNALTFCITQETVYKVSRSNNDIFKQIDHVRHICNNGSLALNFQYEAIDQFITVLADHLNDIASNINQGKYYRSYCYILRTKRYKNNLKSV